MLACSGRLLRRGGPACCEQRQDCNGPDRKAGKGALEARLNAALRRTLPGPPAFVPEYQWQPCCWDCKPMLAEAVRLPRRGAPAHEGPMHGDNECRRSRVEGASLLGYRHKFVGENFKYVVPMPLSRLAKEAHRRIPMTVLALQLPAPVGDQRQSHPNGDGYRTGQV